MVYWWSGTKNEVEEDSNFIPIILTIMVCMMIYTKG
jgi:hypothetical protein